MAILINEGSGEREAAGDLDPAVGLPEGHAALGQQAVGGGLPAAFDLIEALLRRIPEVGQSILGDEEGEGAVAESAQVFAALTASTVRTARSSVSPRPGARASPPRAH